MSAINTSTETNNGFIYPVNGKSPSLWGSHYDREVRVRIVSDIAAGLLSVDEMAEMISVGKSYIMDWGRSFRADVFGKPRSRPGAKYVRKTYGCGMSYEQKKEIVRSIVSGQITLERAAIKHKIYPSRVEYWTNCKRYNSAANKETTVLPQPVAKSSPTDRLVNSPKHSRIVIDLLLNGSTEQALVVARAFLATL